MERAAALRDLAAELEWRTTLPERQALRGLAKELGLPVVEVKTRLLLSALPVVLAEGEHAQRHRFGRQGRVEHLVPGDERPAGGRYLRWLNAAAIRAARATLLEPHPALPLDDAGLTATLASEDPLHTLLARERYQELLARLKPRERAFVALVGTGFTVAEAGARLGLTANATYVLHHRLRNKAAAGA